MKKMCSSCKTEKLFSEFFARKSSKDGLQNQCKLCKADAVKRWRAVNPEAVKEHNASSYVRNTESVKASVRRWRDANPERARALDRAKEARKPDRKRARTAKRKASLLRAIPSWVDMDIVNGMYQLAGMFRRIGLDMEVDHIVPLQGETVTGLHTQDNLQLMLGRKNTSKGNRAWPDMP